MKRLSQSTVVIAIFLVISTIFVVPVMPFALVLPFSSVSRVYRQQNQNNKFFNFSLPPINVLPSSNDKETETSESKDFFPLSIAVDILRESPSRAILFSISSFLSGALLGPFLDSYHSSFDVLAYNNPIYLQLWGTDPSHPALTTAIWVPPLFGIAGFLISWLYILLDAILNTTSNETCKGGPEILVGIALFTFQYWLSGALCSIGVDRSVVFAAVTVIAVLGFQKLDGTKAGFIVSLATALGGPLIEIGLLTTLPPDISYQYIDKGETGFFPLWIIPVYFLGGPANGNLARGVFSALTTSMVNKLNAIDKNLPSFPPGCKSCNDSRAVPCPNCEGEGYYITYDRSVKCNCCKGRGLVLCRDCFSAYNEDPSDIDAIREVMSRMPD